MPGLRRLSGLAAVLSVLLMSVAARGQYAAPVTSWPVVINGPSGQIQIYQPQPERLDGDLLKARAAVSLMSPGSSDPVFGAIWMTAHLATNQVARTATILDVTVTRVKFPDVAAGQDQQFAQTVQQQAPAMRVTFSLDQLAESLDVAAKEKLAVKDLSTAPPKIIYVPQPATLVLIDGQPQLQPVDGQQGLMRVVNSPFIILMDMSSRQYFLKAGLYWYSANDVTAPWANVSRIPSNVLAAGTALSAPPPGAAPSTPDSSQANPGQIIVSEEPAELIWTDGQPTYTPIAGNNLLYVNNTQSDIFMDVGSQQIFVLLSGRWFTAHSLQGPWTFVASNALPPSVAQIPPDSPKAYVLASVAGTTQAQEARLDAQVPQTAAIDRNAGQSLSVAYDGAPQFEAIAQTPMSYAVNCADPVILVNNRYYCCHQAVWYEAGIAVGPWNVCLAVPDVIYTLPPTCPIYNVRYCYVYSYTPQVVYCGYLPGYTGCYVYSQTVVYGTGYYYHGWYRHDYYPRPFTWGFSYRYDPFVATWGCGAAYHYNNDWFIHDGDHHGWWGPRGYVGYENLQRERVVNNTVVNNTVVNNTTVIRNTTINRINIYDHHENVTRKIVVQNHERPVHGEIVRDQHVTARPIENPVHDNKVESRPNNVYAGHDGTVYRRTDQGWEQHTPTGWSRTNAVPEAKPEEHVAPHQEPVRANEHPAERPVEHAPPAHEEPARTNERPVAPAHEQPVHTNERPPVEHPANTAHPDMNQSRIHEEETPRGNSGLEADHAARQRGDARVQSRSSQSTPQGGGHGNTGGAGHGGSGNNNGRNDK